jgi:hypothetical protein
VVGKNFDGNNVWKAGVVDEARNVGVAVRVYAEGFSVLK